MLYDDKQRAKFLDIMKALAISCVLLGHCEFTLPFLKELIYSFHMPAFFIVYGLSLIHIFIEIGINYPGEKSYIYI